VDVQHLGGEGDAVPRTAMAGHDDAAVIAGLGPETRVADGVNEGIITTSSCKSVENGLRSGESLEKL
jgi:hypothetical protein